MIWSQWLSRAQPKVEYQKFQHFEFVEQVTQRSRVEEALARVIYFYHTRPKADTSLLATLGYSRTGRVLAGDQRPVQSDTRKAHFAEILACEFVQRFLGYEILHFRLHYNPNPDQSMKGEDILGFRTQPKDGVLVGEAKYRSRYNSRMVQEAYEALQSGFRPSPASMDFVATLQDLDGHLDLAARVRQVNNLLMSDSKKVDRAHLLFLTTVGRPQDPFRCIEEKSEVVRKLVTVNVVFGEGISEWINILFERSV